MSKPKNTRSRSKASSVQSPSTTDGSDEKRFAVGYGKPPVATRFKPGQCGNPKGRPKGAKSMATIIRRESDQKITIQEGPRTRTVTKKEALFKATFNRALQKGGKDADAVFRLLDRVEPDTANDFMDSGELSRNEADILDAYTARLRAELREELESGAASGEFDHPEKSLQATDAKKTGAK